jgi:hypothetical protein
VKRLEKLEMATIIKEFNLLYKYLNSNYNGSPIKEGTIKSIIVVPIIVGIIKPIVVGPIIVGTIEAL